MRFLVLIAMVGSIGYGGDFTTYIGDANQYRVAAIVADTGGNSYVTGSRTIGLPPVSSSDVFVTKLDASGNIVFVSTFGGKGSDIGSAIALDAVGNIWVGGTTSSENFPLRDALQTTIGSGDTGFLVKLAPDGTVIYSSYFGGLVGSSGVYGLATDAAGDVFVTGETDSSDFPATPALSTGTVSADEITPYYGAFITKLDPAGLHVIFSAVISGSAVDCQGGSSCFLMQRDTYGAGVAVDGSGDVLVAGNTNTTDLPVTPGGAAGYGAFAAKINAAGNKLVYLTYLGPPAGIVSLGPSEIISAAAIATDAAGNAYLTGFTNDPLFPATTGAYQTMLNAASTAQGSLPTDAFAIKLDPSGATLWATFLGGPGTDVANSISVDSSGDVWLTGNNAAGFPGTSAWTISLAGNFLTELSANGSTLVYSEEFPQGALGQGVSVDPQTVIHVAGETGLISTITSAQPTLARILGIVNAAAGQLSGRISQGEVISIFGFGLGPDTPVLAKPGSDGFFPNSLAGVQVLVNGAAIPLLYVSASQINAELPAPLTFSDAQVQVVNGSAKLPNFRVSVDSSNFNLFLNPNGSLAAINQDGTVNSPINPAKAGSIITIWGTGFGTAAGSLDGAVSTVANNWCADCQATLNGDNAPVEYAGAAPGLIDGIMQINLTVPMQFALTEAFLQFSLGGSGFIWVSP